MAGQPTYDESFYRAQKDGSYRSAELTIPKLFNSAENYVCLDCIRPQIWGDIIYPAGMTRSKSI